MMNIPTAEIWCTPFYELLDLIACYRIKNEGAKLGRTDADIYDAWYDESEDEEVSTKNG